MAQIAKLSGHVELKSAAHKFYGFFRNNIDLLVHMFPNNVKNIKFLEGSGCTTGALMLCDYDLGGEATMKARIIAADDENRTMTFETIEGDILRDFSLFKVTFQALDDNNGVKATVNWSFEYQKANENAAPPQIFLDFALKISIGLDAYLAKN